MTVHTVTNPGRARGGSVDPSLFKPALGVTDVRWSPTGGLEVHGSRAWTADELAEIDAVCQSESGAEVADRLAARGYLGASAPSSPELFAQVRRLTRLLLDDY